MFWCGTQQDSAPCRDLLINICGRADSITRKALLLLENSMSYGTAVLRCAAIIVYIIVFQTHALAFQAVPADMEM